MRFRSGLASLLLLTAAPLFAQSPIVLPIEVFGPDGTIRTVDFRVGAAIEKIDSLNLTLTVNGIEYEGQGAFQLNEGPWVAFSDKLLTPGLQVAYGGIGGGFSTLIFRTHVPLASVAAGGDHIRFAFTGTDGNSSGFRVLEISLAGLSREGQPITLFDSSSFPRDNPDVWTPPLNDAADISEGQRLWESASLVAPQPGGRPRPIRSHCADCHAADGRDLKYFNYSNYSIETRAVFHGLTTLQGKQVASYIRTLKAPNPGRPWNPPYQPGPGLDAKAVDDWSAGAGLDAVLNSDAAMLPYVAPTQSSADFNPDKPFIIRNTPIAFQLPDWNRWLPRVHPIDVWGDKFSQSTVFRTYQKLQASLIPGDPGAYAAQQHLMNDWSRYKNDFIASVPRSDYSVSKGAEERYSLNLWQLVKMWELNQQFGLEGMSQAIYGSTGESRSWTTNIPFQTSPTISKIPQDSPGIGNGSRRAFSYFSFMWYYSQLILNGSNKQIECTNPVDWGYIYGFIGDMSRDSPPQGVLMLAMMRKALQLSNNGNGPEIGCVRGWSPFVNDPSRLITDTLPRLWAGLAPSTVSALINAYAGAWYSVFKNFTPQQFYAGHFTTADETLTPDFMEGNMISRFASMIPRLQCRDLDPELTESISRWAEQAWPAFPRTPASSHACKKP